MTAILFLCPNRFRIFGEWTTMFSHFYRTMLLCVVWTHLNAPTLTHDLSRPTARLMRARSGVSGPVTSPDTMHARY